MKVIKSNPWTLDAMSARLSRGMVIAAQRLEGGLTDPEALAVLQAAVEYLKGSIEAREGRVGRIKEMTHD